MIEMQLVEKHIIDKYDAPFRAIDDACWLSKNLYNRANYLLRQNFIHNQGYSPYTKMAKLMQDEPDYQALPRKVSQQVLMQLDRNWPSFFAALREWQAHPGSNHYVVEVIYIGESQSADVNPDWIAGLDNLAAIASNKPCFIPILVNGRPLKAINQLLTNSKPQCGFQYH